MPLTRSPLDLIKTSARTITGEAIIETLIDWGIEYVFGLPGDNADGLIEGLYRHRDRINFVLVRHEENAAFMATAYYKVTGKMAACLTTAGPGAAHLLNGLLEAHRDKIPVLAMTGNAATFQIGTDQIQEYNPYTTFGDCTVFNSMVNGSKLAKLVTANAIRHALAHSGPALLSIPVDVGLEVFPKDGKAADTIFASRNADPEPQALSQVIEAFNHAKRPIILAGRGCWGLNDALIALSEKVGAAIIKPLWGKDAVSDFHPNVMGGLGLLGTRQSVEAVMKCDLLLMLGTSFPYDDFLPEGSDVVRIQVDQDPVQVGKRYRVDIGVCADVHRLVPLLLEHVEHKEDQSWLDELHQTRAEWNALMEKQEHSSRTPMRPQVVARALQDCAKEDAIIVLDSGANTTWMARNFFTNGRQRFIGSGLMGTMQCGLPYAIGAQIAYPQRQVLAGIGDGDFVMCMGEFTTAVKYQLPIIVTVFNNGKLGLIKYEEEVETIPEFGIHFHNPDFVKFAEACGGFGVRLEDPKDAHDAVRAAIASGKPAIIDAIVEPNEVSMPPKVEQGQATGFGIAFLREMMEKITE